MEVDTATSATQPPSKNLPSELEIYCYFIVLLFLIDQKKYPEFTPAADSWWVNIYDMV